MRVFFLSATRITAAVLLALIGYVAIVTASLVYNGATDNGAQADVIVVMGAAQYDGVPSPLLETRLSHALELWQEKRAPLIVVTGGKQEEDRFTEAASSRRWLTDRGVPTKAIISEDTGRSTWQSLENLSPVLASRQISSAIAVSNAWHVERVKLSLEELGFQTTTSAADPDSWPTGIITNSGTFSKTIKEIIGISFGRIIGFGQLFSISG
jgi:uncharacterized SAM-binding protein YcdF (DUF218 family)